MWFRWGVATRVGRVLGTIWREVWWRMSRLMVDRFMEVDRAEKVVQVEENRPVGVGSLRNRWWNAPAP